MADPQAFQNSAFQNNAFQTSTPVRVTNDFLDYIFQFPDQGTYQRDSLIQSFAPNQGVPLLIYNPVETLTSPATGSNALVLLPQQANSSVALPGFWVMITLQGNPGPVSLTGHPNLQILNNRTLMFARVGSVITTKIDISHINIVINIFGVYVTDGLRLVGAILLEDRVSELLLEDDTSPLLLEPQ